MRILQISAGRERSVVLAADGTAHAWGGVKLLGATLPPGYPGELCTTNPTEIGHNRYAQPVAQALNPGAPFATVADGHVDMLGVSREGAVLSCRPVVSSEHGAQRAAIAGLPASPVQVLLTESAALALYADGAVWSWGLAAQGQLGRAAQGHIVPPGRISGLPAVRALAAGHGHVLALDRAGKVWAWGANAAGQLGQGTLQQNATPMRVALPAPVQRIAAGETHSFAVDAMGRLWGWGANNFGQVGDPTARFYTKPTRVETKFTVAQLDGGMYYTVATSTRGDVFAWGWNSMGQLGRAGASNEARPVRVPGLTQVSRLSAGMGHVLALSDRGVHAWGDNRASACGQFPSNAVQPQPVLVTLA
jgi:alpha-tubulin suppressor-like RCC1 family protein